MAGFRVMFHVMLATFRMVQAERQSSCKNAGFIINQAPAFYCTRRNADLWIQRHTPETS